MPYHGPPSGTELVTERGTGSARQPNPPPVTRPKKDLDLTDFSL